MSNNRRPYITFNPHKIEVLAEFSSNLLEIARNAGIGIDNSCGGLGKCGKCRIIVHQDRFNSPTDTEREMLTYNELRSGYRLACQTTILDESSDLEVYIPSQSLTREQRFQLDGLSIKTKPDPPVRLLPIEIPPATMDDVRSDLTRLKDELKVSHKIAITCTNLKAIKELPRLLRQEEWRVNILLRGKEIISIMPRKQKTTLYGLSLDLGTSKIAFFLVDLTSGKTIANLGLMNPQLPYGDDVISRIQYANEGKDQLTHLRDIVIKKLNIILGDLLLSNGLSPMDIVETCIVGNTAMHHLFLGLPVRQLGFSPFIPAITQKLELSVEELGLNIFPQGKVYLPPPIAGFVGSDHLAAIIATQLHKEEGPCLLIDVGTNTEVSLQIGDVIICCSCASGPAFEGGALKHGMRAVDGAIERVSINPSGCANITTVGDSDPTGLCGSGILDALADMKEIGVLNGRGRLQVENPGVIEVNGELAFKLVPSANTESGWITITQKDVREIQKAKGAVRSGIEMLMDYTGIKARQLKKVIIAGAFGNFINPLSALSLGMIPPVLPEYIMQV